MDVKRYFNKKSFTFYWKIKRFSLVIKNYLESPIFRVAEIENTEWRLYMYPDESSNVILNIERMDKYKELIHVYVKLFLLKTNGEKIIEETKNVSFKHLDALNQSLEHDRQEILQNEELYLPDDILTVFCVLKQLGAVYFLQDNVFASIACTAYSVISAEKISVLFPFNITQQQQIITIAITSMSKKYPSFRISLNASFTNNKHEFKTTKIVIDDPNTKISCKCKLSVNDENNKTVFLFKGFYEYNAKRNTHSWSLPNSATLKEVTDTSTDSSFFLRCELDVSDGTYSSYIEDVIYSCSISHTKENNSSNNLPGNSLKHKLKCLLDDSRLCDFTFQVDGVEFKVHKAVLAAVSPVFSLMFELKMKEKESSISALKQTESVDNLDWESAIKLFSAADMYQIDELKHICAAYLIDNLTKENVTEVLTVSDMYQDANLEKAASDFLFANAKEVCKSDSWRIFIETNMRVAIKTLQNLCLKFVSNSIF